MSERNKSAPDYELTDAISGRKYLVEVTRLVEDDDQLKYERGSWGFGKGLQVALQGKLPGAFHLALPHRIEWKNRERLISELAKEILRLAPNVDEAGTVQISQPVASTLFKLSNEGCALCLGWGSVRLTSAQTIAGRVQDQLQETQEKFQDYPDVENILLIRVFDVYWSSVTIKKAIVEAGRLRKDDYPAVRTFYLADRHSTTVWKYLRVW